MFKREYRYIVLKHKDVNELPNTLMDNLEEVIIEIDRIRRSAGKPLLSTVVVEKDWPEYELVWQMLEARMTGKQYAVLLEPIAERFNEAGKRIADLERELTAAQATIQKIVEASSTTRSIRVRGQVCSETICKICGGVLDNVSGPEHEHWCPLALPADRTALDAMLKEARREGMQRAERICRKLAHERFLEYGTRESDTGACYYTGASADEYEIRDEEDEACADAIRQAAERSDK